MPRAGPHAGPKCEAERRGGKGPCTLAAGWGTDHVGIGRCKFHGGMTPSHKRAARKEIARRECAALGIAIEVDPGQALLTRLWEVEGDVAFYRSLVEELGIDVTEFETGGGEYAANKRVPHVHVTLYHQAQERSAQIAAAALRAGVEDRLVRMAEADARELYGAVLEGIDAAGLSAEQAEVLRRGIANAIRARRSGQPAGSAGKLGPVATGEHALAPEGEAQPAHP